MILPNLWGLRDTEEAKLKTIALSVWSIASDRLSITEFCNYTDHSISHSQRITKYIEMLLNAFSIKLDNYEKFVLVCAVALHDIGMNASKYVVGINFENISEKLNYIRENHHLFSKQCIDEQYRDLGLICDQGLIDYIANVAMCHRKINLSEIKDTEYAGRPMRLKLLSSILRLCDCLDCSFNRVKIAQLDIMDIENESFFFWYCHYFVQSINIIDHKVKIIFRFSENDRDASYISALQSFVISDIKQQIDELYNIMTNYNIEFHRELVSAEVMYMDVIKSVPDIVKDYIITHIVI